MNKDYVLNYLMYNPTETALSNLTNDYRIIRMVDDELFKNLIAGIVICKIDEGLLMLPYTNLSKEEGYEQFILEETRIANDEEVKLIQDYMTNTFNDNLEFISSYMKEKEENELLKLSSYKLINLLYEDNDILHYVKNNHHIIKDLEALKIETFKKIDYSNMLYQLISNDSENDKWAEIFLINNNKIVLIEGYQNCDLEDINIITYTKEELSTAFKNIKQGFKEKMCFIEQFKFENLLEE